MRSTTFLVLGLFFSLAALRHSSADANHEVEIMVKNYRKIYGDKKLREEMINATVMSRRPWKGRKMIAEKVEKKEEVLGAKSSQDKAKKKLNLVDKLSSSRRFSYRFKLAGLMPFNSDYHAPKIHPPKNN